MANEHHLNKLRQGIEGWNNWRKENIDIRPDLSGANLMRASLSGADLSSADLSGADLVLADLSQANLSAANLSKADLRKAKLIRADLREANLREANLSRLPRESGGADLSYANLTRADLREAKLWETNLRQAILKEADLRQANLADADLSGADLSGTSLGKRDLLNEAAFKQLPAVEKRSDGVYCHHGVRIWLEDCNQCEKEKEQSWRRYSNRDESIIKPWAGRGLYTCPKCGGTNTSFAGSTPRSLGGDGRTRFNCGNCGHQFTS